MILNFKGMGRGEFHFFQKYFKYSTVQLYSYSAGRGSKFSKGHCISERSRSIHTVL
jgi:hypothetical protein